MNHPAIAPVLTSVITRPQWLLVTVTLVATS